MSNLTRWLLVGLAACTSNTMPGQRANHPFAACEGAWEADAGRPDLLPTAMSAQVHGEDAWLDTLSATPEVAGATWEVFVPNHRTGGCTDAVPAWRVISDQQVEIDGEPMAARLSWLVAEGDTAVSGAVALTDAPGQLGERAAREIDGTRDAVDFVFRSVPAQGWSIEVRDVRLVAEGDADVQLVR